MQPEQCIKLLFLCLVTFLQSSVNTSYRTNHYVTFRLVRCRNFKNSLFINYLFC